MALRAAESNEDAALGAMSEAIGVLWNLPRTASSTERYIMLSLYESTVTSNRPARIPFLPQLGTGTRFALAEERNNRPFSTYVEDRPCASV